jgi:hypothetical protein
MIEQLNKSIEAGFYFESMFLEYAMMEDRLRSILCHSNLTKTKKSEYLDIPETKQEVINIYNNIYNTDKEIKKLKLNEIRTKIEIIEALIKWTSMNIDSENQIQEDLKNKFSDLEVYIEFFKSLKEWCTYRNHLIHAIFDKNMDSVNEELLSKVHEGKKMAIELKSLTQKIKNR